MHLVIVVMSYVVLGTEYGVPGVDICVTSSWLAES